MERGVSPISCNSYFRVIQSWCTFMYEREILTRAIKVPKLRCERRLKNPLSDEETSSFGSTVHVGLTTSL